MSGRWLGAIALILMALLVVEPAFAQRGGKGGGGGRGGGPAARGGGGGGPRMNAAPRGGGGARMSARPSGGARMGGAARMSPAPRANARSFAPRAAAPQRMQAQSRPSVQPRINVQPRVNLQTSPRAQVQRQLQHQPRATQPERPAITQRPAIERRPQQAGDVGRRARDLSATRPRDAINRGTYDSINRARERAVGADRIRDRVTGADRAADVARGARPSGRTDLQNRERAELQNRARQGGERLSADARARARARDAARPSRGDIDRQLGLQNRANRLNSELQRRALERPQWVSTRNDEARRVNESVARAIRDPERMLRGDRTDRIGDRIAGDRLADRGDRIRDGARAAGERRDWARWRGGDRWNRWADPVRRHWRHNHSPWFNNNWWARHHVHRHHHYLNYFGFGIGPWGWGYRPWNYWWNRPTWYGMTGWFDDWGWYDPWYYDYGYGGNVVYYDDGVYIGDVLVGTPIEYAESAAALATVPEEQLDRDPTGDWMPLGTFAMVANAQEDQPNQSIQLAVDKNGIVSGTYFDRDRDEAFAVTGRVDRETQRVAFRIDNNPDVVYETGIYNLTQDQTPVLVHDGSDDPLTYLLVRLEQPEISR